MRRQTFARSSRLFGLIPGHLFDGQTFGAPWLALAAILVLISALRPAWFMGPRAAVQDALAPPLAMMSRPFASLSETLDYLSSLARLEAEAQKLRADNKRLEEWYNAAQLLQAENQSLRDLLKVKVEAPLGFVTARVIGDVGGSYAQSVLVQAGAADGIQKGSVVLAGEGVLGRIAEVNDKTSVVMLMNDASSRIPVRIEKTTTQAILGAAGGGQLILDRLPDGVVPRAGQRILTSGVGGVFPPNLPVGTVVTLPGQKTVIEPYADMSRLVFVRIVRAGPAVPAPDKKEQKE